jgi:long-chain acyl-CoA synthetase
VVDLFADKVPRRDAGARAIPNVIVTQRGRIPARGSRAGSCGSSRNTGTKACRPSISRMSACPPRSPRAQAACIGQVAVDEYRAPVTTRRHRLPAVHRRHDGRGKGRDADPRNLLVNMEQTMELIEACRCGGEEVALTALPTYHIFAFTVNLLGFYSLGARNILIPNPRPLSNLKRAFENYPDHLDERGEHAVQRADANESGSVTARPGI